MSTYSLSSINQDIEVVFHLLNIEVVFHLPNIEVVFQFGSYYTPVWLLALEMEMLPRGA